VPIFLSYVQLEDVREGLKVGELVGAHVDFLKVLCRE
jgi:hypothetical protein